MKKGNVKMEPTENRVPENQVPENQAKNVSILPQDKMEEAKKLLLAEQEERGKKFMQSYKELCEQFNYELGYFENKFNGQIVQQGFKAVPRQ